jgi:hypothetical protein
VLEAVGRVERALWGITTTHDLQRRLGTLLEQAPWPSLAPLLNDLARQVPEDQRTPTQVWARVRRRAEEVFGSSLAPLVDRTLGVFADASRLELKMAARPTASASRPLPWGGEDPMNVLFQDDFPPTLRQAILGNQEANLCGMALVGALLDGKPVDATTARLLLETWISGKSLFFIVGVGLLGDDLEAIYLLSNGLRPPTVEELIEEGRRAKANLDRMLSDEEPDWQAVELDVRRRLEDRGLDPGEVLRRAASRVEHLGLSRS